MLLIITSFSSLTGSVLSTILLLCVTAYRKKPQPNADGLSFDAEGNPIIIKNEKVDLASYDPQRTCTICGKTLHNYSNLLGKCDNLCTMYYFHVPFSRNTTQSFPKCFDFNLYHVCTITVICLVNPLWYTHVVQSVVILLCSQ